jgi:RNA polymerase sigma factor (sigma-70 family)
MTGGRLQHVLRRCKRLFAVPATGDWSDRRLLERFASQRDETAFASLVRRHGPLVLGAARRVLQHTEDAEDVFQTTFLILARKAGARGWRQSIAGWLYCVAYRLALRTRAKRARQGELDRAAGIVATTKVSDDRPELYSALDQELQRLSARCREPLLLCYLEGKTRDQAARELGWSLRTLERRLQQGLKLLRARLCRRGIELPAALLTTALCQQAASALASPALAAASLQGALSFASGSTSGGAISGKVLTLAEGGLRAMAMTKLKIGAVVLAMASVIALGVGAVGQRLLATNAGDRKEAAEKEKPPATAKIAPAEPVTVWPEGTTVRGRVVNQRGAPVANAEVVLLGKERVIVDADRRTWFVPVAPKDRPELPSTRTNKNGEFSIKQLKGPADRLAVIAEDPLLWVISRKNLAQTDNVEIKLPASGSLTIRCDLPGKAPKQPVMIQLRSFDGVDWNTDSLRFHMSSFSVTNPGEKVFEHLPPGRYAVQRSIETRTGNNTVLMTDADRQLVKVEPDSRPTIRFERKAGRPLSGQVRGLEKIDLRYAHVLIGYFGPEEQFEPDGRRSRLFTAFDVIPIGSDGKFTTGPIPPGEYHLHVSAMRASTPEQSNQQYDFNGFLVFKVPERGDMPKVEVTAKPNTAKPNTRLRPANTDYRVRVVDDAGKPLPAAQAMLHTANAGYISWNEARSGVVSFGAAFGFRDAEALDILVRADGYAPALMRFAGEERDKLSKGEAIIKLKRGQRIAVHFHLPPGMTWPKGAFAEAYFDAVRERVRTLRQPGNRRGGSEADFNIFRSPPASPGSLALQLTPATPPFHVAIHAPGFLQCFDAGPFTLDDAKEGVLDIDVPRPASLDVHFAPLPEADKNLSGGVSFWVMRAVPESPGSYLTVARHVSTSGKHEFRLSDLAPGDYLVDARTLPVKGNAKVPGTDIDPGAYFAQKKVTLRAGQAERLDFKYTPFDSDVFRGTRTAVLRVRVADGRAAGNRQIQVRYVDGHYGEVAVFSGRVSESGTITLKNITDRPTPGWDHGSYAVTIDGKHAGFVGFTKKAGTEEFDVSLPPTAGDLAPNVELLRVASGETIALESLRGKVVCLEFWATWCGPCQPALESLNRLAAEQDGVWKQRVAIIPASIDANRDRLKRHIDQRGWDRLEHHWCGDPARGNFESAAARAFGVNGVPECILIGPDGRILWRGHPSSKDGGQSLKARIEAAIGN